MMETAKRWLNAIVHRQPGFWSIFAAILGIYLFFQPVEFLTTDGAIRDFVAHNLYYDGELALTQVDAGESLNHLWTIGRDGRPYAYFGIGQSLLEIPFIALLEELDRFGLPNLMQPSHFFPQSAVMVLSSALTVAFLFGLTRQLGYRRSTAFKVAMLVAFGSILWGLSRESFDMVQEAMGISGALYFLNAARCQPDRSRLHSVAAGLLYGLAVITRISAVAAGPALALLILGGRDWRQSGRLWSTVGWFAGAALAISLIVPAYNWLRFGDLLTFGYAGRAPYPGGPLLSGLAAWLISPWWGILLYAPLLLVIPLTWRGLYQRHRVMLIALLLLFATYLVFYAQFTGLGAVGWGPYYMLPGLLPLYVLLAAFIEGWPYHPNWQRRLFALLAGLSIAIEFPATVLPPEYFQSYRAVHDSGVEPVPWSWALSPPVVLTTGAVAALQNLPNWQEYMDTPARRNAQTLLNELYAYNLPDWWWLYRLFTGGESALLVPMIALLSALWLFTRPLVMRRDPPDH